MEILENGTRFYDYVQWESTKNQAYDYKRYGLLRHLLSHKILESKNTALQALLKYIETTFVMVMKFINRMKNFKNYAYSNR